MPAGRPAAFSFRIIQVDGRPVRAFEPDQTKLMHLYLIRDDLTGFQHVHPAMAADGTWTATLHPAVSGTYRAYASFKAAAAGGMAAPVVLSQQVTLPGAVSLHPLPPASARTTVDGYTLTVQGEPMSGMAQPLTVAVAKAGRPVTDLQPYLATYAHLTAIHEQDLAFAHLHPDGAVAGGNGGPTLAFQVRLPKPGRWRLFIQFQTAGRLHTAAITLAAG